MVSKNNMQFIKGTAAENLWKEWNIYMYGINLVFISHEQIWLQKKSLEKSYLLQQITH